jgi:hypothetical protein
MHEFHNIFDPRDGRIKFEATLRYFIWGGRENYELRQKLSHSLKVARGSNELEQFELPGWDKFVEMVRMLLDAPHLVASIALPLKDLAFREVNNPNADLDRRLADRFKSNNRVRQFSLLVASYLVDAVRLPKDFRSGFASDLGCIGT